MPEAETITTVGVWGAAIALVGVFLRLVGPWRKQITDVENRLREEMGARITKLENDASQFALIRAQERARHEAEMRVMGHRLQNETASLDALLMLLETAPEKVSQSVTLIKEMRAQRADVIAAEQAALLLIRQRLASVTDMEAIQAEVDSPEDDR